MIDPTDAFPFASAAWQRHDASVEPSIPLGGPRVPPFLPWDMLFYGTIILGLLLAWGLS